MTSTQKGEGGLKKYLKFAYAYREGAGGECVKKYENFADVVYEWSLTDPVALSVLTLAASSSSAATTRDDLRIPQTDRFDLGGPSFDFFQRFKPMRHSIAGGSHTHTRHPSFTILNRITQTLVSMLKFLTLEITKF